MAWSDLTITRNDIDSFEGATFSQYGAATELGIADNDRLALSASKSELEDDVIRTLSDSSYKQPDGTDYTEAELLDAVQAADDRDILKRMLTYKFLANWFFQDSSKEDSLSWQKAREYLGKYYRALNGGLAGLAPKMDTPRNTPRFKMRRV